MPGGRPTKFTPEVKQELLERMRQGESTRAICRDAHMPDWSNLGRLLEKDKEFREHYAQAREMMVDAWVLDTVEVAQNRSRDTQTFQETVTSDKGTIEKVRTCSDNSASMRDRLIIDTNFKAAALMLPKKYGVKIVEHTGADGGPIKYESLVDRPVQETPEQWQVRVTKQIQEKKSQVH